VDLVKIAVSQGKTHQQVWMECFSTSTTPPEIMENIVRAVCVLEEGEGQQEGMIRNQLSL
jgi:hypothetical protein